VLLELADGAKKTTSYARFLVEQDLGRWLSSDEHVDHIDKNCSNDEMWNLQILTPEENWARSRRQAEVYYFFCPVCKIAASQPAGKVRHNRKQGKSGPYCSKRCARAAQLIPPGAKEPRPFNPDDPPVTRKATCPQGHPKDGWRLGPKGRRYSYCMECNKNRAKRSREKSMPA
jgi:hypothetical protein